MNIFRTIPVLTPLAAVLVLTGCVSDDAIQQAARDAARPIQEPSRQGAYVANANALERSLHKRIDEYRRSIGLPPLAFNPDMTDLAREHSRSMAERGRLDHRGFSSRVSKLRGSGVSQATENVAYSKNELDVTRSMLRSWIQSPPHRDNLSAAADTRTGVGIAQASDGSWYATAIFGR